MRIGFAFAAAFALLSACAAGYYFAYIHNVLVVESPSHGHVKASVADGKANAADYELILSNRGLGEIRILDISASCACTKITCEGAIKPFSSVKLAARVEFPAGELEGRAVDIAIKSDARNSAQMHRFVAESGDHYSYWPQKADLGKIFEGRGSEAAEVEFLFKAPPGAVPKFDASASNAELAVGSALLEDGQNVEYPGGSRACFLRGKVSVRAQGPLSGSGRRSSALNVSFSCGAIRHDISVPVEWEIVPSAYFSQGSYIFSERHPRVRAKFYYDSSSLEIRGYSVDGGAFEMEKAELRPGLCEFAILTRGKRGGNGTLSVELSDGAKISARLEYAAGIP